MRRICLESIGFCDILSIMSRCIDAVVDDRRVSVIADERCLVALVQEHFAQYNSGTVNSMLLDVSLLKVFVISLETSLQNTVVSSILPPGYILTEILSFANMKV